MILFGLGDKLKEIIESALSVNLAELLINLLATVLLIIVARFVFWKPISKFLDAKKAKIKKEYELDEEYKNESIKLKNEAEQILEESKVKASRLLASAEERSLKQKEEIISKAKKEAKDIKDKACEDAKKEKSEIIASAKDDIVDIAKAMASKVIDQEINKEDFASKVLEEIKDEEE